jgi:hypothetical protein
MAKRGPREILTRLPTDPNQLAIFIRAAAIRRTWSEREEAKRRVWATDPLTVPTLNEADFFAALRET